MLLFGKIIYTWPRSSIRVARSSVLYHLPFMSSDVWIADLHGHFPHELLPPQFYEAHDRKQLLRVSQERKDCSTNPQAKPAQIRDQKQQLRVSQEREDCSISPQAKPAQINDQKQLLRVSQERKD